MTIIATGGFSTKNMSIGFFDSVSTEIVVMIFMIISSLPFILIFQSVKKGNGDFFNNSQVQFFLALNLLVIFFVMIWLQKNYEVDYLESLRIASFSVISIATGSGFSTYDFSLWGTFTTTLFLFIMLIGGCSGSSSCGLKVFRIQILFKYLNLHLKKMLKPHIIVASHFNGKKVNESTYESVMSFFFIYILTFFISALLLSFSGLDFLTCVSAAASAISNVGPGLGEIIGPYGNYNSLTDYSKVVLLLTMFLGRLEMLTILILFIPSFWRN